MQTEKMENGKKTFVLDTEVLLLTPYSIFSFDEHDVILADVSVADLNKAKDFGTERGRNAKEAIRLMEELSRKGSITQGVQLPGGGTFRIHSRYSSTPIPLDWDLNDPQTRILRACKSLDENVTLVTNNMVMRLKADMIGIPSEPFKTEQMAEVEKQYTGRGELIVPAQLLDTMYADGAVEIGKDFAADCELVENKYFILRDEVNPKHTGLGIFRDGLMRRIEVPNAWGVKPRNVGQKFALHALMAPASEIPCVILKGGAGTGKTMLSVAAALQGVLEDHTYIRCLTSRPNFQLGGEEIGFLKGSEEDKIGPLIRPIFDNLEQLTRSMSEKSKDGVMLPSSYAQKLYDERIMVSQALGFMRGRSIADQFIIIDEAQNMTPLQAFSIISRAGEGSKLVLCGDVQQIDNVALDSRTNGLTYASERLKGSPLVAQVTFENSECERSALAAEALRLMSPKGSF